MYIYILMFFVWLLISKKWRIQQYNPTDTEKWSLCWKLGIPLFLVMGLRHVCVGSDTEQYLIRFEYSDHFMTDDNYQWEKGYNILNYVINNICHLDFQWLLLATSALFVFVLSRFISRYSTQPLISFYLHVTISIFAMSLSGIRQIIAISICYIAYMMLDGKLDGRYGIKDYVVPTLLVCLAYTFHNSSVIFLPLLAILIAKIRLNKMGAIMCLLVGMSSIVLKSVYGALLGSFMVSKYQDLSLNTNYAANILVLVVPIAITLFCIIYSKTESDGKYNRTISMMFVMIALTVFFINLQSLNNQLGRLSYYFIFSYLVLIPYTFSTMPRASRNVLVPLVLLVCTAYFIIGNMGDVMQIDDYHFFWEDVNWTNRGDALGY